MTGFFEDPAPFGARLDKAAFFAWVQTQDGRFELKDGHIVMHAGSTRTHARISTAFVALLRSALSPDSWSVTASDFAVEIGPDIRYPDVMVEQAGDADDEAYATDRPVLLIEVLSPSSVSRDMHLKLAEYTSLPSLQCYLVASQDEPIVWMWQRDADTTAFPALPEEIKGLDARVEVRAFGIVVPLGEIYRGLIKS